MPVRRALRSAHDAVSRDRVYVARHGWQAGHRVEGFEVAVPDGAAERRRLPQRFRHLETGAEVTFDCPERAAVGHLICDPA